MPDTLAAMRVIVAAGVVLLALTGCTPSTNEASANCARTFTKVWQMANPDATSDEVFEQAIAYAEQCEAAAAADPEGFIEQWGD